MQQKKELHVFNGMQLDMSISKHPANFLYEAHNIRITAREDDTLMSISNERGPVEIYEADGENISLNNILIKIEGKYLGHALLNKYLVVFSTGKDANNKKRDHIYRIDLSRGQENEDGNDVNYELKELYDSGSKGDLGFDENYPIETLASYENESIQKVYWVDGKNPPRVINIVEEESNRKNKWHNTYFDFLPTLTLKEDVYVSKQLGSSGTFPAGVIQYCFTYYNKHGLESNIFYTSPLLYISHNDRGGKPDDVISNAFHIKIINADTKFDYIRIYSILRTSLDATPICKRVADISPKNGSSTEVNNVTTYTVTYTDTGVGGSTIDPTELLYKGGESIIASTITQKDGTIFLGDIKIDRDSLADIKKWIECKKEIFDFLPYSVISTHRALYGHPSLQGSYYYCNLLTMYGGQETSDTNSNTTGQRSVPCGGFKKGNTYRLGIQFQHKTGVWSLPIWCSDVELRCSPVSEIENNDFVLTLPIFEGVISKELSIELIKRDYLRARPLVVFPESYDRKVISLGIINPTIYSETQNKEGSLNALSSWFFRPNITKTDEDDSDAINSGARPPGYENLGLLNADNNGGIEWGGNIKEKLETDTNNNSATNNETDVSSNANVYSLSLEDAEQQSRAGTANHSGVRYDYADADFRSMEILGNFSDDEALQIRHDIITFHSPDFEFNEVTWLEDYSNINKINIIGSAYIANTFSDIDIQTETPTISSNASGFIHKTFKSVKCGIVSGLFYEDYFVDDYNEDGVKFYRTPKRQKAPAKFMVYLWHGTGSLNNDTNRSTGVLSAKLKKKVISNFRYFNTEISEETSLTGVSALMFNYDLNVSVKSSSGKLYKGNIDTVLIPATSSGTYFAFGQGNFGSSEPEFEYETTNALFTSDIKWRTGLGTSTGTKGDKDSDDNAGLYSWNSSDKKWVLKYKGLGNVHDTSLAEKKKPVRMTYKSTPHMVIFNAGEYKNKTKEKSLCIAELIRNNINYAFGGKSGDALRSNKWIPCGEPVMLNAGNETKVKYSYGDTYYQRWDCLKTYAYTKEDLNQVIEIGSFMLETYVNIDGRYDKNRGLLSSFDINPTNFNLLNKIYTLKDNFFTYRILDDDLNKNTLFRNLITWSKEKSAGADIDLWTNITLASTYDLDGSKGSITKLETWKDKIFCFLLKGVSNIMFNSRVAINTSDGIPIELSNSYKVDGYKYLVDYVGCDNKWSIKATPSGIYFIDFISNNLFSIGDNGLIDVSSTHNMSMWFKNNNVDRTLYDNINRDLYLINNETALCFSETLNQFTSFMSYEDISLIEAYHNKTFTMKNSVMYKMFSGKYNDYFGSFKPWDITFVSNGLNDGASGLDKVFTNLEYRMDVYDEDGNLKHNKSFDYILAYNEFQDTTEKDLRLVLDRPSHISSLKKKFRVWRIDVPRNNPQQDEDNSYKSTGRRDRIRNTWCKIKLGMKTTESYELYITGRPQSTAVDGEEKTIPDIEPNYGFNDKAILHDMSVLYYI